MPIAPTREQLEAWHFAVDSPQRIKKIVGSAGVGKSFLIDRIAQRLPNCKVMAPTGKAVQNLREKGIRDVCTIHSGLKKCELVEVRDALGKVHRVPRWKPKTDREVPWDTLIFDEGSQISRQLLADILAYDRDVILVGDNGQLEPVGDPDFDALADPDITLTQPHRFSGEIAHFAHHIREGNPARDWLRRDHCTGDAVRFVEMDALDDLLANEPHPDQLICAFNRSRVLANEFFRQSYGYPSDAPVVGDRIMCLQNDANRGLYNGMQGVIAGICGDELVFQNDELMVPVRFLPAQFNNPDRPQFARSRKAALPFDYSYAITAHKAQGSEWDRVLVLEQVCAGWSHTRWSYTAATRAKKQLIWVPA